MKKLFSVLLAAVLAAGTMVLPTAAADGDIVYLQTFDNVASYDDLGWEIVETLTTNTSTYTIENGALTVDNLGGNDSYTVVVPASVMDEVNKGDYTVGYDFTLLESGDTARYLAMLLNYDREVGNTYNSLHMRMKGYADWQNRFVGTWSSNMDLSGGYQGLPVFTSKDDGAISNRLFGLAFNDGSNVIAGKTIRYEMRVSNSGGYAEVYMNGVLISGTDEAGWDQFTWASEDYSEICLKSGGSILGTVDNVVVAKGLGIPEGTLPAMEGAAASSTGLPATEYDSIANYAGIKPVIDGKIDAIWDATAAQESTYPGDRDGEGISGYTKILWDEDGIYYLGVVNDPTTLMEANPAGTDSIDFWVSETYSDEMGYPLAGDYQISLSPYNTLGGYYIGNEKAPESVKEHAAVINGDGTYVLEIAMPWMDPDFKPAAGAVIGYNASFNNDIDGDAARDSWTSWVEWNGMPYWSDSMWLGQVELVKADVAVAVDEAPAADAPAAEAPAAAAEFVTYTEYPEMTGTELVYATGDMDMLSGYDAKGGIGVDLFNLASGGTSYCLKRDTSAWYDFEVAEKTDVTFYVGYIARDGSNRGLDYAVDGGARIFMDLAESAEQQWVSATFTVDAGKHSFYLYAPTGMDDSTLKSCDIYTIELYGTPAAAEEPAPAPVVEEAPAVEEVPAEEPAAEEAPAEEVPVEEPAEEIVEEEVVEEAPAAAAVVEEAPQTFDFGVIAAISALVSLAGFSLTKKR
jgi:hypothetical protein